MAKRYEHYFTVTEGVTGASINLPQDSYEADVLSMHMGKGWAHLRPAGDNKTFLCRVICERKVYEWENVLIPAGPAGPFGRANWDYHEGTIQVQNLLTANQQANSDIANIELELLKRKNERMANEMETQKMTKKRDSAKALLDAMG